MNEEADLILRLLTLAGSIMEDASPIAIIGTGDFSIADRIAATGVAAERAGVLIRAAEVLRQRTDVG